MWITLFAVICPLLLWPAERAASIDACTSSVSGDVIEKCMSHIDMGTLLTNVNDQMTIGDMIDLLQTSDIFDKTCRQYRAIIDCQINLTASCPSIRETWDLMGFNLEYSKSATEWFCKSKDSIYDDLRCVMRRPELVRKWQLCVIGYSESFQELLLKQSGLPAPAGNELCSDLATTVTCLAKEMEGCGKISQIFKDFAFGSMTNRCYIIGGYTSPSRIESSSASLTSVYTTLIAILIGFL